MGGPEPGDNPRLRLALDKALGSNMPKDTIFGFRKDITEMIKEWTPSYIRWPGGNFLSGYHWENAIGNKDYRMPYYDHAWYQWEYNDVGTDEFFKWCEYIGSEPMITINTGDGSIEDAQNWIEYITGDHRTTYGKKRIKNGRKKPYHLKTILELLCLPTHPQILPWLF